MKLGRIQKRYVAVIILATALISSFVTYSFAGSISNTLTLSAGVYPGAPSYTIWTDGTNYYAKDQNGIIDYYGTDFVVDVLQETHDDCDDGDSIFIKNGEYEVTSTFSWTGSDLKIYGEQFGIGTSAGSGTVFIMPSGTTLDPMVDINASCFNLENIYFWNEGYSVAYDGVPIQISRSDTWMSTVRNVQTRGFDIGCLLQSDDGAIDHVHFYNVDFGPSETANLKIYRTSYYIADCSWHTLRSDATSKKADYGIFIDSADANTVALMRFYDTTVAAVDTTGIYMDNGWYNKFMDTHFDGTFPTHIELTAACYLNDFVASSYISGAPLITDAGAYNSYTTARGYFENFVTAVVKAGEYVAHGLAGTPTYAVVSCNLAVYDNVPIVASTGSKNSTHIQIYVYWTNGTSISADAITITLYAKYVP